jgi:hypothetical protein
VHSQIGLKLPCARLQYRQKLYNIGFRLHIGAVTPGMLWRRLSQTFTAR